MFPEVDCIQAKDEYFEWQRRIKGSKIDKFGRKQIMKNVNFIAEIIKASASDV